MPMLIKIPRHNPIILAPLLTERIPLNRMLYTPIITQRSMTSIPLRIVYPLHQRREVPAHLVLLVTNRPRLPPGRHQGVVRTALDVLSHAVETVVDVVAVEGGSETALVVGEGAADELLQRMVGRC